MSQAIEDSCLTMSGTIGGRRTVDVAIRIEGELIE
jgi:hypothetical protein